MCSTIDAESGVPSSEAVLNEREAGVEGSARGPAGESEQMYFVWQATWEISFAPSRSIEIALRGDIALLPS
jgi:hypothetical protein